MKENIQNTEICHICSKWDVKNPDFSNCNWIFQILMILYSVLHGDVILPCLALSCRHLCTWMNGKGVMCHPQKNTNATHSNYLTLQQYILNIMIIWLPPTRQISQEPALVLPYTLVEGLLTLRSLAQQMSQHKISTSWPIWMRNDHY